MPSSLEGGSGGLYSDPAFQLSAATLYTGQTISSYDPGLFGLGGSLHTTAYYNRFSAAHDSFSAGMANIRSTNLTLGGIGGAFMGGLQVLGSGFFFTSAVGMGTTDVLAAAIHGRAADPSPTDRQTTDLLTFLATSEFTELRAVSAAKGAEPILVDVGTNSPRLTLSAPTLAGREGVFRNLKPLDAVGRAELFPASQIQRVGYTGKLDYVVLESGELVIGRSGHISLSRGADVLAAGEARFFKGGVKQIDNFSGHYRPSGDAARAAAENAFNRAGFNATGRYKQRNF